MKLTWKKNMIAWDTDIQTNHPIQTRMVDLIGVNNKGRICQIVEMAKSANHGRKVSEGYEKLGKYQDSDRYLRKVLNSRAVPIIVGVLGILPKL